MIDMLARVQRMYETAQSIDSGSGMGKKHERVIQLRSESNENLDRRCSKLLFPFCILHDS